MADKAVTTNARFIGIRHRIKMSAENEARPTQVVILKSDSRVTLELATEMDEVDFVLNRFPVKFRPVTDKDKLDKFLPHQIKWRRLKKTETPDDFFKNLLRQEGRDWYLATQVPCEFDGLKTDDTVAMVLGGSGDNLAYALSEEAAKIGASLLRLPPAMLCENRKEDKEQDALNLALLAQSRPGLFYPFKPRDRSIILVRECLRARIDAMKARIACEQQLRTRFIGATLRNAGLTMEGNIEDAFNQFKASDVIFKNLLVEENAREKELIKAVQATDIYQRIFEPLEGCGPMISARLISSIIDIKRFATTANLKAFCGVHLKDGEFCRKRHGQVANWHNDARGALYLLTDQFNRRPNSTWGQKLRENKTKLRVVHPETIEVDGKKRYSDAHIHKMALWRTATQFVVWLHKEWWKLETANGNGNGH